MKHTSVKTYLRPTLTVLLAVLLAMTAIATVLLPSTQAQGSNRVGLVVHFGGGNVTTRCITFGEPEITGYDVLLRSGLAIVTSGYPETGIAVCDINGQSGCGPEDCFCRCQGSPCNYWSYWYLNGGNWSYAGSGASDHRVHDGDVEGWNWGEAAPPPVIPFDQICAPPPPTDTPIPTNTPVPPTATSPPPTDTPPPAPTSTSPPPMPVVWFRLDNNPVAAGDCTMVRWDTTNALDVYLDGEPVDLSGGRQVCPTAPQEYHLRVVGTSGEETHTLTLGVTGTSQSLTPTTSPTALQSTSPPAAPQSAIGTQPPATAQPAASTSPPPSPIPQSTSAPPTALSATILAAESTSLPPSSTPVRVAFVPPLASPTQAAQPAPTPSPVSSAAQPTLDDQRPPTTMLGYITFNFIAIGLLGWLGVKLVSRR